MALEKEHWRTGAVGPILNASPPSFYNSSLIHEFGIEQALVQA